MKKAFLALFLCVFSLPALATSITGKLAIAGLDMYNSTGITFVNPGTVLSGAATGSFAVMLGTPQVTMNNELFGSVVGSTLFDWNHGGVNVMVEILSLKVLENTGQFLNVEGRALISETGFTSTDYSFTFTSTKPDDITSYTADFVPVPEPGSLLLLGTGMLLFAAFCRWRHAAKLNLRVSG